MKTKKMLSKIFCALLVMAMIATSAPLMGFATDAVTTSKPYYIVNFDGGVKISFDKVDDDNAVYDIYRKHEGVDEDFVKVDSITASKQGKVQYLDYETVHLETYTYDVAVSGGELSGSPLTIEYVLTPDFTAQLSPDGLKINIEYIEGVDYYRVMRNDGNGSPLQTIATVEPSDAPSYFDSNVNLDDNYVYMVRAYHNNNVSFYHQKSAVLIKTGVKSLSNVNSGVKVSFEKVENAASYIIYRKTDDTDWTAVSTFKARSYNYDIDYSAVSGTIYYYTIAAVLEDGTTSLSTSSKKIMYLEDPSLFLSIADDGIVIDFTPVNGADYYQVLRSPAGASNYLKIGNVNADENCTFTDKTAVEGESYSYAVRAVNNSTDTTYTGYMQQKAIDYAIFTEDDTALTDTAITLDTTADTTATETPAAATTDTATTDTATTDTTAAEDVAAAEKTVTDIIAQVFSFIADILTKLGVDASFLDNVLPVVNTIFGFVNNIISITG